MYLNPIFFYRFSLLVNVFILLYLALLVFNPTFFNIKEILAPMSNRELGLIESLQHCTLFLLILAQFPLINHTSVLNKLTRYVLLLLFVFVFFEEVDYFINYTELILKQDKYSISFAGYRNVHNISNLAWIRKIAYWVMVCLTGFVLFKQVKYKLVNITAIPIFMMFFL